MTLIEMGMLCLPENECLIVRAYYYDGYTQAEIAKQMNTSQPTTYRLIARATAHLRNIIARLDA